MTKLLQTSLFQSLQQQLRSVLELSSAPSAGRMSAMEGIRGLAILLVFLTHYYGIVWLKVPQSLSLQFVGAILGGAGGTGVDLFFVMSGFLIYGAVRKPNLSYRKFLARRIVRIYPTFVSVLLVYLLLTPFLSHSHAANPQDAYASRIPPGLWPAIGYLGANLTFLPGVFNIQPIMNVAWSLSYEWFFYLSLPLLVILFQLQRWDRRTRVLLLSALTSVFAASALLFPSFFYFPSALGETCYFRAMMFFGGMIVYELYGSSQASKWLSRTGVELTVIVIALLSVLCVSLRAVFWPRIDFESFFLVHLQVGLGIGLLIGYSALVMLTLSPQSGLNRVFSWSGLRWLGNMSYSFYLIHGLPLHLVALAVARSPLAHASSQWLVTFWFFVLLPPVFLLTSACSLVLFAVVEKPFSLAPHKGKSPQPLPSSPILVKASD